MPFVCVIYRTLLATTDTARTSKMITNSNGADKMKAKFPKFSTLQCLKGKIVYIENTIVYVCEIVVLVKERRAPGNSAKKKVDEITKSSAVQRPKYTIIVVKLRVPRFHR